MAASDAHSTPREECYGSIFMAARQWLSLKKRVTYTVRIDAPLPIPMSAKGEEASDPICTGDEASPPGTPSPSLRRCEPDAWKSNTLCGSKEPTVQLWKVDE